MWRKLEVVEDRNMQNGVKRNRLYPVPGRCQGRRRMVVLNLRVQVRKETESADRSPGEKAPADDRVLCSLSSSVSAIVDPRSLALARTSFVG
jgi:hypothetical protein